MKVVYTFEVEIPGNEKEEFDPKNFPRPRDVLKKLSTLHELPGNVQVSKGTFRDDGVEELGVGEDLANLIFLPKC